MSIMDRARYNATPPTIPDGQDTSLQTDANGSLKIISATIPGSATTALKAEDAAHVSGDPGNFVLAVANEAAVNFAADGDYVPIGVDRAGRVYVRDVLIGGGATSLGKAEDSVHTTGDMGVATWGVITDGVTANAALGDYSLMGTDLAGNVRTVGNSFSASATFTPAASAHTTPAVNGGAQQFALSAVSGSRIKINSVTLEIDNATIETTAWVLYLYNVTPPSAIADAATFDLPSGDRASFLGKIDIAQVVDLGSTLWIEAHNIGKQIKLSGTSVFGYLVNGTTLTPTASAHVVTLHCTAA